MNDKNKLSEKYYQQKQLFLNAANHENIACSNTLIKKVDLAGAKSVKKARSRKPEKSPKNKQLSRYKPQDEDNKNNHKFSVYIAKICALLKGISAGFLAGFLFRGLLLLIFPGIGLISFFITLPISALVGLSTFSQYVDDLEKRIPRVFSSKSIKAFFAGNKKGSAYYIKLLNLKLTFLQKLKNKCVFAFSIFSSLFIAGGIFYSTYKTFHTLAILVGVNFAIFTPIALTLTSLITLGSLIGILAGPAVSVRKRFRFVPKPVALFLDYLKSTREHMVTQQGFVDFLEKNDHQGVLEQDEMMALISVPYNKELKPIIRRTAKNDVVISKHLHATVPIKTRKRSDSAP